MSYKLRNLVRTTLLTGISAGAASLDVMTGEGALFDDLVAGDSCDILVTDGTNNEYMRITGRSGDTLTIGTRGVDSTTDQDWLAGAIIERRLNKGMLEGIFESMVPPGAVMSFALAAAPTGWLEANGGTIGDASSGGTSLASANAWPLFSALWNAFPNTVLPIQTSSGGASTRGASAAADFSAHKRMPLFDIRGEFIRGWDHGRGVDSGRGVGSSQAADIGPHSHHASGWGTIPGSGDGGGPNPVACQSGTPGTSWDTANSAGTETRPRNLAFLYCIKM